MLTYRAGTIAVVHGLVLAGLALAQTSAPASAPASLSALASAESQPAIDPAEALRQWIAVIAEADKPATAIAAYGKASSIDRNNRELNRTYMRRMLQLGQPPLATHAARVLKEADPPDTTALALLAYNEAVNNRLVESLSLILQMGDDADKDPAVMHNLGQIVALFGELPDGTVPTAIVSEVKKHQLQWETSKVFTDAMANFAAEVKALPQTPTGLRAELKDSEEKVKKIVKDGGQVNEEYYEKGIDWQKLDRQRTELNRRIKAIDGQIEGDAGEEDKLLRQRDDARYDLERVKDRMDKLKEEAQAVKKKADGLNADLRREKDFQAKARRDLAKAEASLLRGLTWRPPSVDGVSTPPSRAASTSTAPATMPRDAEQEAKGKLSMARLYVRNRVHDKARALLTEIGQNYPDTLAAKEAATLMKQLPKE